MKDFKPRDWQKIFKRFKDKFESVKVRLTSSDAQNSELKSNLQEVMQYKEAYESKTAVQDGYM